MLDKTSTAVNGIDLAALDDMVGAINADASCGNVRFSVRTEWTGQTRSESIVEGYVIGGRSVRRNFTIVADEPHELLGADSAPNPQELLMAAFNACITVGRFGSPDREAMFLNHLEKRLVDLQGVDYRPLR